MGTLKNSFIVIPAKAGIQSNHTDGFRGKPGMTNYSRLPNVKEYVFHDVREGFHGT
jgi:hypothetical protein